MSSELSTYVANCRDIVNIYLQQLFARVYPSPRLNEAMRYSVLSGGKRVRATLVFAACALKSNSNKDALPVAAAVELMHCYSLIHDDLPAMDDDDMRRDLPSCHIAFGEAEAILAGDAMQTTAFELLADEPIKAVTAAQRVQMISILAKASGQFGMAGGQMLDLSVQQRPESIDIGKLRKISRLKTGALISASVQLGAVVAGIDMAERAVLSKYGSAIGLAFQIIDDILDHADEQHLSPDNSKKAGLDSNMITYTNLIGVDAATEEIKKLTRQALDAISGYGDEARHLRNMALYLETRST